MKSCNHLSMAAACTAALLLGACAQNDPLDSGGGIPGDGAGDDGGTGDDGSTGDDGGDGGDGDTGGEDGDTGGEPGDPAVYFPLVDGGSWTYVHKLADGSQWTEEVSMAATEYGGASAFMVSDTPDPNGEHTEAIFAEQNGTVYRIHKEVFAGVTKMLVVDYDPGFPRFDAAWTETDVGIAEPRDYQRTETDGQGLNPLVEPRTQQYTVVDIGHSATVPAGAFDDCISVRRERLVGGPERTKVFTFCAGIGKVKEVNETAGSVEELTAYTVPE